MAKRCFPKKTWIFVKTRYRKHILGVFGNTALFSVGTLPLQSYYLHRCGMMPGASVGTLTLEYVVHKLSVLLYALAALLVGGAHFIAGNERAIGYLVYACVFVVVVSAFLVLICIWEPMRNFLIRFITRLPDTAKWKIRKHNWLLQIDLLYNESQLLLQCRTCCVQAFLLNIGKLFSLYSVPFLCFRAIGIDEHISFWQCHLLAALMVLLTSALPNIAGMGPTEFSFLLIFTPFTGKAAAITALLLYRVATYYSPFFLSCMIFIGQQHSWQKNAISRKDVMK